MSFLDGFSTSSSSSSSSSSNLDRLLADLYRQQLDVGNQMFSHYQSAQMPYELDYYSAARNTLPEQAKLMRDEIERARAAAPLKQFATEAFFKDAYSGVEPEEWANRAGVDVAAAYAGADAALRRDAARMGVDPSSGRFAAAQRGYGLNMARDVAQMRTAGRRAAEEENWKRLSAGAQFSK